MNTFPERSMCSGNCCIPSRTFQGRKGTCGVECFPGALGHFRKVQKDREKKDTVSKDTVETAVTVLRRLSISVLGYRCVHCLFSIFALCLICIVSCLIVWKSFCLSLRQSETLFGGGKKRREKRRDEKGREGKGREGKGSGWKSGLCGSDEVCINSEVVEVRPNPATRVLINTGNLDADVGMGGPAGGHLLAKERGTPSFLPLSAWTEPVCRHLDLGVWSKGLRDDTSLSSEILASPRCPRRTLVVSSVSERGLHTRQTRKWA